MDSRTRWLSTQEVGLRLGMSGEWVRRQIVARRLTAAVYATGRRRTYRIAEADLEAFLRRHRARTDDPDWE